MPQKMAKISGKYLHVKNENVADYYIALGFPEKWAQALDLLPENVEFSVKDGSFTMKTETQVLELTLGEEVEYAANLDLLLKRAARFEEEMRNIHFKDKITVKCTVSLQDGDTLVCDYKLFGMEGSSVLKFSDEELLMVRNLFLLREMLQFLFGNISDSSLKRRKIPRSFKNLQEA